MGVERISLSVAEDLFAAAILFVVAVLFAAAGR